MTGTGRRDLSRLLRPRSIAVVGGGFFGTNVVRECRKMGFAGAIWPVHPSKDEVGGIAAYRSIADLPDAPDAAFIGVNRFLTVEVVGELASRGAGGAVCFASGFKESADDADGARLHVELLDAAGVMPVIGPNCYGLINYVDGAPLWPDQHGGYRLEEGERGVAIITQSSNIAINMTMQRRGLPIAYLMTAGNQAQTGLSEIALGLIEDDRVSALGLHIEGFDSVAGFEGLAARARELSKPIVAMKVGRSEQARAATVSHTASLAGSDAASEAFLKRLGVARVDTIPSFLETLKLLHAAGPLAGPRLSSMSCSGGEASVMADAAHGRAISFPPLSAAHKDAVGATLGPLVAIANPLDYHTFIWNDESAMSAAFTALVAGGFDLNMLVLDFPRGDRCSDADWWPTVNAFEAALKANVATGAIVASLPENLPEAYCAGLLARGIVPLSGIAEALDAAEAAAFIGEAWRRPISLPVGAGPLHPYIPPPLTPPHKGEGNSGALTTPSPLWGGVRGGGIELQQAVLSLLAKPDRSQPDEAGAKAVLAGRGLPVPAGRVATTIDEAAAAAEEIGYPVAVKALGLAHKSEHGAVRLNLNDSGSVQAVAADLLRHSGQVYVERMIVGGVGELIVGVTRDPLFGPVMTVGTGGVLVELLKDSVTLLLPASRSEIEQTVRGLKLFPLLDGYRGRPKADLGAAVDAIAGIAAFVIDNAANIEELDINPLIVCAEGEGAWIADALLVTRE
ncbi:MAG: acetate--CoA ligase family protein [Neoaquamicrobium sediminum]|uniref:acetate--CoA ligase family protein n=1 Tax=Neoaquamicrobium sediminum TaxID=1849104 RepID=UPI004036B109